MRLPRRPVRSFLAAVTVVLLSTPAGAYADGWYAGETFATSTTANGSDLAVAPDGNAAGVWLDDGGSAASKPPADLLAQVVVDGRRAGPPVRVTTITHSDRDSGDPRDTFATVATGPGGTAFVAWIAPVSVPAGAERVKFARLRADGSAGSAVTVPDLGPRSRIAAGVDDRGIATIAVLDDTRARALRIAPTGEITNIDLGAANLDTNPAIAVSPAGTAWIAWNSDAGAQVARLDPQGVPTAPTPFAAELLSLSLTVAPGGAAAAVVGVEDPEGVNQSVGARLAADGAVLAGAFRGQTFLAEGVVNPYRPSVALAADGTVTVARSGSPSEPASPDGLSILERFKPGSATGTRLSAFGAASSSQSAFLPAVTAAADGRVLLAWQVINGGLAVGPVRARTIAPGDGLGAVADVDAAPTGFAFDVRVGATGLRPVFTADGAVIGIRDLQPTQGDRNLETLRLRLLDPAGPQVDVDIPTSGQAGTPVRLSQTASDPRGIASQSWDFGDGSTGTGATVTHVYGPGTYTVKALAADGVGNVTEVTRQLTITAPPVAPPPPVVPPPPPVVPPPPVALPPAVVTPPPAIVPPKPLAAAKLGITRATRTKRRLAVAGTIARSAGGRVTISYRGRLGGALITLRKTTLIRAGRWSATLILPSSVLRARQPATVVLTYAGDSDTRKGTARRTVVTAKVTKTTT